MGHLGRLMDSGDAAAQRDIFREVERSARELGHGSTVDEWGDELRLFRAA